ncbi:MAG: OPT/YSL family transporter [Ignavibacteriales bacterium]|nr:OPT/YSL family transporter [Ignavibacteriales bacterium]
MKEFTVRALIIGLFFAVILGAANAYLGLKAGMTIAATYPAAVLGMAILRLLQGSILEENFARTVGSIGESVAAGAIFTLPAFFISGIWPDFSTIRTLHHLLADPDRRRHPRDHVRGAPPPGHGGRCRTPFPESVAAAEIHKAGQAGSGGSKFLF